MLVTMCYLYEVIPLVPVEDPPRELPGLRRGQALCTAFETYRRLVPSARISFEHAVFLVVALAMGDELQAVRCAECSALTIIDPTMPTARRCLACEAVGLCA